MRAITLISGVVGCAVAASAQPIETLTYSVEWDQSVIFEGANTGAVYAEVTPAIGTTTAWNSVPGKGQAATLMAFAASIFDLMNTSNGTYGTLTWNVPDEFNLANKMGTPDGKGGISNVNTGQFAPPANPNPNTKQKVKLLDLTWTLDDPAGIFQVSYTTKATSAKVFLDLGLASWVGENAVKVNGEGGFLVKTPVPSVMAFVGLAGIMAARRRR